MKNLTKFFAFKLKSISFLTALCIGASNFAFADTSFPRTYVDAAGNLTASWLFSDGSSTVVQTASASFGGSWSTPTTISGDTENPTNPILAVNTLGDAVVFWVANDPTTGLMSSFASIRPISTGVWSSPAHIANDGAVSNDHKISINESGQIVATWTAFTDETETTHKTYAATATVTSGTWSSATEISD